MAQRDVWIDAEDCLRQKLSCYEDYACRYDGLAHKYQRLVVAHHAFYARFEQHGDAYTVDHKHNVVAHEHRGNKHVLTAVERVDDAACQPFFLRVDNGTHLV